jgi:methyl-accepting chemotaxis protein-1 (serine sensor receptor)
LGWSGALAACVVGVVALFNVSRMAQSFEHSVSTGSALQLSQKADMMHDAVRADVLQALLGATAQEPAQISEAQNALREHTGQFQSALVELQALALSVHPGRCNRASAIGQERGCRGLVARISEVVSGP